MRARVGFADHFGAATAPNLPPLTMPKGPDAQGNVASDVQAALAAKSCPFSDDGSLDRCEAESKFRTEINNFVKAKAPRHIATYVNLLGSDSPAVRVMLLDYGIAHYIEVHGKELTADPKTYEPILAAALAETDTRVRSYFSYEVSDLPIFNRDDDAAKDPLRYVPYLGQLAERYSHDEGATELLRRLDEGWHDDDPANRSREAVYGAARRNADPRVRLEALQIASNDEEKKLADDFCSLVHRELEAKAAGPLADHEDHVRDAVDLFVERERCAAHDDAWLAKFPARAKAGTLDRNWLAGASWLAESETHTKAVTTMAKTIAPLYAEEHELHYDVQDLLPEASQSAG